MPRCFFAAGSTRTQLDTFCANGGLLGVHPEHELTGVDFSTGSLGHGPSFAAGAALAARMQHSPRRSFVLVSDAECNEGALWETVMVAAHHRLSNLVAIVDVNGQQACGIPPTSSISTPLGERWAAFGWDVHHVDGHDVDEIAAVANSLRTDTGQPHVLIARTTFGKGVSYMERQIRWHYLPMSDDDYRQGRGRSGAGGVRAAFCAPCWRSPSRDERIVLLTGDLGFSVLEPFAERFPDRYFNVGVAEQNMIGMATGLAEAGFIPFVYSIVTFASLRGYEFIRNGPVRHRLPVRIIGIGGGFEYGHAGASHHGVEDIGVMRLQPGTLVFAPADAAQARTRCSPPGMRRDRRTSGSARTMRRAFADWTAVSGSDASRRLAMAGTC